jgi:chromosome segregation ATPase
MEIMLLVAVIVVGVSALYVAATFNKRTRQNAAPLVNSVARRFEESGSDLRQQLNAIAIELQEERESINLDRGRTQERLDHADRQISSISDKLSTGLDTIKRQGVQIGTWQDQFSNSVLQQLDDQAAHLSESLSRLSAQVARIESYLRSQETQTAADPERSGGNGSIEGP